LACGKPTGMNRLVAVLLERILIAKAIPPWRDAP
jgi:hypothetical protein